MSYVNPFLILVIALPAFWLSARIGCRAAKDVRELEEHTRDDLKFLLGAALTLLGLIIGFTFSMAISRYDHRKNLEAEEANAIGTEWVRADLLPLNDAANVRMLLADYLTQRMADYRTRDNDGLRKIEIQTAQLQNRLWLAVKTPALNAPSPVIALAVSGMNDVLNSQGYTAAAWRNRVPIEAWLLMGTISILCNLLLGYSARGKNSNLLLILPVVLSVSLFLVADIDSPRRGFIHVRPLNLEILEQSLK